ncbi:kinase-like domain-containing protein [Thelonectria olida]|uniref:non-specific serine/threonine protein kinase n=1 Tax=Thelonectria olida TaxID=1576542 RepID=A0A9P8WEK8_9HYPO|nr:kinase-like domain-containing protein [Thelonectria olida]
MGESPVNKGSHRLVQTPSQDSLASQPGLSLPTGQQEASAGNHVLSFRRTSSKVWSDIRGAIKAIGRSSNSSKKQMDSQGPSITRVPGKTALLAEDNEAVSPSRKGKGISPEELLRNLQLNHPALASSTTIVLRNEALRTPSSVQALAGDNSSAHSESNSPYSSAGSAGPSTTADDSTTKTSADSRLASPAKDTVSRRHSRRIPWTRSSPEGGALGTIDESRAALVQPSVATVERAAAAKIYFETKFSYLLAKPCTRAFRRQLLETQLYCSPHLTSEQKAAIRESFNNQETWHLRELRVMKSQDLSPEEGRTAVDNYEPLQILGKGSFGVVRLVREKPVAGHAFTGQVYAMKVIRKSTMLRSCQEGHLRAERDFLVGSNGSDWVVPLIASFQDAHSLYLVMEYMPGGDFLGFLIRENILHESIARFYIAEMILAVEEAHRLNFIHRDIKPDNFLISASGHLKISDFGLAFDGHWSHDASYYNCHRYSLVRKLRLNVDGDETDQKSNRGILTQFDWYKSLVKSIERHGKLPSGAEDDLNKLSIGIILFECLYGHTPFLSEDGRKQTKQNIVDHKRRFFFPQTPLVSDKCKDLIFRLIKDKEQRLCSRRYHATDRPSPDPSRSTDRIGRHVFPDDAEDIKAHRWFKTVPWDRLQTLTPPFIPQIHGADDSHYFDESETIEDWSESSPPGGVLTPDDVREVLRDFSPHVQDHAIKLIESPFDSTRLRKIDGQIETSWLRLEEKEMLKHFVRLYGQKERKRPRDILLRDQDLKEGVMDIRKKTAFMGYAWRRMRPGGYTAVRMHE